MEFEDFNYAVYNPYVLVADDGEVDHEDIMNSLNREELSQQQVNSANFAKYDFVSIEPKFEDKKTPEPAK